MIPVTPRLSDVRRAISHAQENELAVVGKAEVNGIHVYAVPSRTEPHKVHLAYIDPVQSRVICDCPGFQFRGVCAHAMVVTRTIIDEAQATLEAARNQRPPEVRQGV